MALKSFLRVALLFALFICGIAEWGYFDYRATGPLEAPKTVLIARGQRTSDIAALLEKEGVIRHRWNFVPAAELTGARKELKAGEYRFPAHVSSQGVLWMLTRGQVVEHKLTVPEGFTVREITLLLQNAPDLSGTVPAPIAEGSLLPQTYYFLYGDSRAQLVSRMRSAMNAMLQALWPARDAGLPVSTPEQALILASIVEKETGLPEERPMVAAVFENRLKLGMKLQADPTVRYGLGLKEGPLAGALTASDLAAPTPYNTYLIDGLPPTPICNPGRASIFAALHPAKTNALYFVATGTVGHRFAATLKEHNANVRAYRAARAAHSP